MAGFSKSLSHLLELDFVLLGYSNFLLIILDSKEQSEVRVHILNTLCSTLLNETYKKYR